MHLYRFILYSFVCISSMSYYWCGPRLLSNNACPYDLYVLFLCPSTPLYRSSLGRPCRSCILYIVCIHHLIRCYTLGLIISYFFLSLIITKIYHCIICITSSMKGTQTTCLNSLGHFSPQAYHFMSCTRTLQSCISYSTPLTPHQICMSLPKQGTPPPG